MTFNEFCDSRKILYYREPFSHYLMSISFQGTTEKEYDEQWDTYLKMKVDEILGKP